MQTVTPLSHTSRRGEQSPKRKRRRWRSRQRYCRACGWRINALGVCECTGFPEPPKFNALDRMEAALC